MQNGKKILLSLIILLFSSEVFSFEVQNESVSGLGGFEGNIKIDSYGDYGIAFSSHSKIEGKTEEKIENIAKESKGPTGYRRWKDPENEKNIISQKEEDEDYFFGENKKEEFSQITFEDNLENQKNESEEFSIEDDNFSENILDKEKNIFKDEKNIEEKMENKKETSLQNQKNIENKFSAKIETGLDKTEKKPNIVNIPKIKSIKNKEEENDVNFVSIEEKEKIDKLSGNLEIENFHGSANKTNNTNYLIILLLIFIGIYLTILKNKYEKPKFKIKRINYNN